MTKKRKKSKLSLLSAQYPNSHNHTTISGVRIAIPMDISLLPFVDSSGLHAYEHVHRLQSEVNRLRKNAQAEITTGHIPPEVLSAFVAIATNAWRAKTKMIDSEIGEPREEML